MILKKRIALNGIQLDAADSRILIQNLETEAPNDQLSAVAQWGGSGSRVTAAHRDYLGLNVKFGINEKTYNPAGRMTALEAAKAWACAGGWLTASWRPGRKIRVIPVKMPADGDPGRRGTQYTIGFRAYGVPYWQAEEPAILRWTGVSHASGTIGVEGSAQTVVEAEFRNTSGGTIDSVHLAAGGSWLDLDDLGLGNGETLVIDHEDTGSRCVLRIRIGNRSVLGCRTGSDDLFVNPGSNGVSLSADGSGVLTFRCAGRYL